MYASSVYPSDLDADGDMDVIGAAAGNADDIFWWENADGSGTSWVMHIVDGTFDGAFSVHASDIDGDGDMDVLGAAGNADDITWWANADGSGTNWVEHTVDGGFDGACSVHASDVDGDGDMDVLGAASLASEITWWENSDTAPGVCWITHTVDGAFDGAFSVRASDVDGDGDMDVLGAASLASEITWWANADGSGTSWVEHTVDVGFDYASSVYTSDVDGDGDMDVLGAAQMVDDITWWGNADGSGTNWVEYIVDGGFDGACSVHASDLDGDGDMDVLGAAYNADDITWWENADGSGTDWVTHPVNGSFDGATSVHASDVDGDGDMDVLGAAYYAADITWWEVSEFLESGQLTGSILDAGEASDWGQVTWTESVPENTDLTVELRAGNTPGAMGSWILIPSSGDEIPSGFDGMRYIQYRITMSTEDNSASPCLEDITVDWTPWVGIEEETGGPPTFQLIGAFPNPTCGFVQIDFSVPEATGVELTVYDLAGRSVAEAGIDCAEGMHSFTLDGLAVGVYLVHMRAGDFEATERFVVLE